jgi:hypothetical protein
MTFKVGDKVRRKTGFHFPGVVLSVFSNLDKTIIFAVVECTAPACLGMVQTFRVSELMLRHISPSP